MGIFRPPPPGTISEDFDAQAALEENMVNQALEDGSLFGSPKGQLTGSKFNPSDSRWWAELSEDTMGKMGDVDELQSELENKSSSQQALQVAYNQFSSSITPQNIGGHDFYPIYNPTPTRDIVDIGIVDSNNAVGIERTNDKWQGQSTQQSGRFVSFDDVEDSYRAAARIISKYRDRGVTTVEEIINTWAPKMVKDKNGNLVQENNPDGYINTIKKISGFNPNDVIDTEDELVNLLYGMTVEENRGWFPYTLDDIRNGVTASGNW